MGYGFLIFMGSASEIDSYSPGSVHWTVCPPAGPGAAAAGRTLTSALQRRPAGERERELKERAGVSEQS